MAGAPGRRDTWIVLHFERLTESRFLPKWLVHEHEARYMFCRVRVAGKRVLDCGSGEGKGSKFIAIGAPRLMVALDQAFEAVSLARSAVVSAVSGDAELIPLAGGSVDVVIALEVIEHFRDPESFLKEVARVLSPDGVFIVSTPNRVVRNPGLPLSGRPLNPWHIREWTPEEFQALLSQNFGEIDLYGQQPQRGQVTVVFDAISRFSFRIAAVLRQLLKLHLLVFQSPAAYEVSPFKTGFDYEFMICVCSRPIAGTGAARSATREVLPVPC